MDRAAFDADHVFRINSDDVPDDVSDSLTVALINGTAFADLPKSFHQYLVKESEEE